MTLYDIQECEHGQTVEHCDVVSPSGVARMMLPCPLMGFSNECSNPAHCPGGSVSPVTIDYEAAARRMHDESNTTEDAESGEAYEWDNLDGIVRGWWLITAKAVVGAALHLGDA